MRSPGRGLGRRRGTGEAGDCRTVASGLGERRLRLGGERRRVGRLGGVLLARRPVRRLPLAASGRNGLAVLLQRARAGRALAALGGRSRRPRERDRGDERRQWGAERAVHRNVEPGGGAGAGYALLDGCLTSSLITSAAAFAFSAAVPLPLVASTTCLALCLRPSAPPRASNSAFADRRGLSRRRACRAPSSRGRSDA